MSSKSLLNGVSNSLKAPPIRSSSLSLRDSMNNLMELLRMYQSSTSVSSIIFNSQSTNISYHNIKNYAISSTLTFIDQHLFKRINIPDLPKLGQENLYIFYLIREQQEGLRNWIIDDINKSLNVRNKVCQYIKICKHLKKQHNYNSLFTILKAVEYSSEHIIYNLSHYKQILFFNMLSIFSPEKSYRNYRMYVNKNNKTVPCFPIFARDIYLIFEHNVMWLNEGRKEEAINEDLIKHVATHYRNLLSAQKVELIGKVDQEILNELVFFDEK